MEKVKVSRRANSKKSIATAISMIRDNLSDDKITLYTELPLPSVQIIKQQLDNGTDDVKK